MGTFSRLRYVIAANVNALIEKAEDPEKLLRALIREMEDASEEARMACAELLAEQQRLQRLETRLSEDGDEWQRRAENAVAQGRDDLARAALRAKTDLAEQHAAAIDEQVGGVLRFSTDTDDDDYAQLAIGLDHTYAKNLSFYVQYAMVTNGDASSAKLAGGWHGCSVSPSAAGETASGFSVGSWFKF